MARLIDADELMSKVNEDICRTDCVISTMFDRRFKKLIEEAPTIEPKQEWISVKDRLPEQYSVAIVFDGEWVGEAEYDGKRFHWSSDEDIAFATHWMPLPEPPERVGD